MLNGEITSTHLHKGWISISDKKHHLLHVSTHLQHSRLTCTKRKTLIYILYTYNLNKSKVHHSFWKIHNPATILWRVNVIQLYSISTSIVIIQSGIWVSQKLQRILPGNNNSPRARISSAAACRRRSSAGGEGSGCSPLGHEAKSSKGARHHRPASTSPALQTK